MGRRGGLFELDTGGPVKIADLAAACAPETQVMGAASALVPEYREPRRAD